MVRKVVLVMNSLCHWVAFLHGVQGVVRYQMRCWELYDPCKDKLAPTVYPDSSPHPSL